MVDELDRLWVASMPDAYERLLVPTVFTPFAAELARRTAARSPGRVLELAAGTGVLTRELRAELPDADIVATDLNTAMVDHGRSLVPAAAWRQADAMALPFDGATFDAVTCQFGVMFFPDKPAAFAEARRVLVPGGAFTFTTWGEVAEHLFADALVRALHVVFPEDPPAFVASVPHGYADPDRVVADLAAAGFEDVRVETVTLHGEAASADDIAVGFCTGTPLRAAIEARTDLATGVQAMSSAMSEVLGPGPVVGSMTAHYVAATSPD